MRKLLIFSFTAFILLISFTSVDAQMSCTPQCSGQCPNPKASQFSFSYYMRIGEIRWDATKGTFWSDPGGVSCVTWPTPPNLDAFCSKPFMDALKSSPPTTCGFVDSGRYCINGGGGGCTPPPTPPPGGGGGGGPGGGSPIPGTTFGPQPMLSSVPFSDPNNSEQRYCAYKGADGLPICVCGSEKDEKVNADGSIDTAASCKATPFCLTAGVSCTRVAAYQCTGAPPLGTEGTVVNQKIEDVGDLISSFFTWSLSVLGLSLFAMILYAGFEWLTAAGDPGRIGRAKGRIYNAVLGTILLLSSYIILDLINPNLVRNAVNFEILGTPAPARSTPATPQAGCWI